MTTYVVRRRTDGTELMRYTADAVIEWQGCELATCTHTAMPDAVLAAAPRPAPQKWETIDFLRRFTSAERISARLLRDTDLVLNDFFALLEMTSTVHSDDPDMRLGMGYLVQLGVLTPARRNTILGDAP